MRRAVCLQHVPFEGPGCLAPTLDRLGFRVERCLVPATGLPAEPGDFLLVMGGPMSVNDPEPWIEEELRFIRRAVRAGIPYLGICLGSQFLAKALGGRVYAGAEPELGMIPIEQSAEGARDPAFRHLPEHFEAFAWHGEGIELPAGATRLAGSLRFPVQAFRVAPRALGLLFHMEIDDVGIAALCRACPADLARAGFAADAVRAGAQPHFALMHGWADRMVEELAEP